MSDLRTCCRKHWNQDARAQQARAFGVVIMNPLGMPFMACSQCGKSRCPKATNCMAMCSESIKRSIRSATK